MSKKAFSTVFFLSGVSISVPVISSQKSQRQIYWPDVEQKLWKNKTLESMAYEISVLGQGKHFFWKKPNILVETLDLPKSLIENFVCKKNL